MPQQNLSYAERFNQALQKEHNKVFDDSGKLKDDIAEYINICPVCASEASTVYTVKDGFIHKKCDSCSFIYVSPRLNEEATHAFYNSSVNEVYNETKFHDPNEVLSLDDQDNLANYKIIDSRVPHKTGKKLLEIGPGKGTFLRKAHQDGFEVHAIELNKTLIEQHRPFCKEIYEEDLLSLNLQNHFFDVIYFRDVMEHIPDVIPFLTRIREILKPGGLVVIDTHNIDSFVNQIAGKYHTVLFAFEHPVHWSPKTLETAGKIAGLKMEKVFFGDRDFTIQRALNYHLTPSFTYIFPPRINPLKRFILLVATNFLALPLVRDADKALSKKLALSLNKGAKMQMLLTKEQND
jgi:2-polyprenyl-3-methyl-5-hydroxy-6-metoxy-1,4-benzoquinol methylase